MKLYNLIFTLIITSSSAYATGLTIPNAFSSGTTTSAAEMNANFTAVKSAVDDNDSRINTLESSVSAAASQFMGFSSGTTDGAGGSIGMGNLCHTSFSGSHMCSTVEFAGAKMNGVSVSGSAWALPVLSEMHAGSSRSVMDVVAGVPAIGSELTCYGWTGTFGSATIITPQGGISTNPCSTVNPVACCK